MKGFFGKLKNITPENYYKLFPIEEALLPIFKNSGKEFQNMIFQTRCDNELSIYYRNFVPRVSLKKGIVLSIFYYHAK